MEVDVVGVEVEKVVEVDSGLNRGSVVVVAVVTYSGSEVSQVAVLVLVGETVMVIV